MPARPGAGRPSKFSDERARIIIEALKNKRSLKIASRFAKVDDDTVRNWMDKNPEFSLEVEYAQAVAKGALIDTIAEDGAGAWKLLKNMDHDFKDEVQVQQTNQFMINMTHPNGEATTINFAVQPPSSAIGLNQEQLPDTSSGERHTGGEVLTGDIVAPNKNSNGTKRS